MSTWRSAPVCAGALALGLIACLLWPAAAGAHVRAGTIAVDYTAAVSVPARAGYRAEIAQSDHALTLTRTSAATIVVAGYLGEPMLRLDAAGVWVNAASPTAVATGLLAARDAVGGGGPSWRARGRGRSVTWRDSRAQQLPAGVRSSHWAVSLVVDGRDSELRGELARYPHPPLGIWGLLLAGLLSCGGWLVATRRQEPARAAALGAAALGGAVCPALALGFALDASASPGTWIEGFNEIVFVAVGLAVLARRPEVLRAGAAVGLGLVSLAVALLDSAVFVHPIVLSLLPGALTRLLVVIAAGAGLTAIVLGALGFADLLHDPGAIGGGAEPRARLT